MRKIINIAVVLGAVFCLVGVALARTVWLPEYEEKFEGMDSCAAHGMLSAVEKDEKNLTCLNSQFIQWVGICYKNCKCKFEWTKEKCESKIGGVWRVSGRSCDDGTYVYWEDCVNGACDNRVDNNSEYGCKEYWEDCPSKCKIPYPDNCHNREDVRKDKNNGCAKFWEDCETKCKEEISCTQNDCSAYPLSQKPNNAVSVGECMIGCGDYTPRYKIEACEEGYEMNADKTDCVCKDNECDKQCFIHENKDDDNVAEWAGDSCSVGCGDNKVSYYKINRCKDLLTAETDSNNCITGCTCDTTESCDGYLLSGDSEGPSEEVEHAAGYDKCTPDCGKTWKYKVIACEDGYEMNADKTDCVCKDNECDKQCFIHSTNTGVDGAVWAVDSCSVGCGEDKDTTWYKIDGCEGLLTAERDINNCITGCTCKSTESCDGYPLSGDANGPTSRVMNAVGYANCTPDCGKTWKYKITKCDEGYTLSEDGLRCDPDCDPNDCVEYTVAANERIANASYEECKPSCGGDTMYKLNGCNETFIAKTDASGNITACECPENATLENGECVCPAYSELINGECVCVKYRHWDSDKKKCVCNEGSYETVNAKESNGCECESIKINDVAITPEFTDDGQYCMYGCSLDKYNNIGKTACVIFTGQDGSNATLVGLTKEGKNTCYIDGVVKISPNNNMDNDIPQWDKKTFAPCEGEAKMQVSGTGSGTGWGKMTGKITFNVPLYSESTSSLAFEDAEVTFNEEARLEELFLDGANRIQIAAGKRVSIISLMPSSGNTAIYLGSGSILDLEMVNMGSGNLVIYDQNNKEINSSPCERSCIYGDSM